MRDQAVRLIAAEDAYAAVLISMHTYDLLTEHADRSTIAPAQLPLFDEFLQHQRELQRCLLRQIAEDPRFTERQANEATILDHFRLLQANDNLSLLTCVDFREPAHLLHPLPLRVGGYSRITVRSVAARHFVLEPYPFEEDEVGFAFRAPPVAGKVFASPAELQKEFDEAPVETLTVTVSAS